MCNVINVNIGESQSQSPKGVNDVQRLGGRREAEITGYGVEDIELLDVQFFDRVTAGSF